MTIIDCISDLHGHYPKLEGGDLLIVAGDLTARDTEECWLNFFDWMIDNGCKKYEKIIVIGGNHDNYLERCKKDAVRPLFDINLPYVSYLCDSGTEFVLGYPNLEPCFSEKEERVYERKVLKIWGSPWTKKFEGMNPHCMAFTVDTEEELAEKWALIPDDVDILVTHSPPYGILDGVGRSHFTHDEIEHVGSLSLRNKITMPKLKLHIFGHIHEWGGQVFQTTLAKFVNASYVNEHYEPVNKPVRIVL